jgi:3-hydroxyisobutyrate dehydrogenase
VQVNQFSVAEANIEYGGARVAAWVESCRSRHDLAFHLVEDSADQRKRGRSVSAISFNRVRGFGQHGSSHVRNLLKAGFSVRTFDPRPTPWPLRNETAQSPPTMRDAVATSTASHDAANGMTSRVFRGEILLAMTRPGALLVDSSTISSAISRALSVEAKACGRRMLDAPVSGGTPGAHAGTLTFMVGGDAADVEHIHPVLEAMGKRIVHVGPHGAGHTADFAATCCQAPA